MVESWDNSENFVAVEVPRFALAIIVVNDDRSSDGVYRCGIKVERSMLVLTGRNSRGYGRLSREITGEFSLRR